MGSGGNGRLCSLRVPTKEAVWDLVDNETQYYCDMEGVPGE